VSPYFKRYKKAKPEAELDSTFVLPTVDLFTLKAQLVVGILVLMVRVWLTR